MALVLDHITPQKAQILIWRDEEDLDFFYKRVLLTKQEKQSLAKYTAKRRVKDRLIARYLLQKTIPKGEIVYLPSGKPYLKDNSHYISISHTQDLVAIILHPNQKVGIDIEYIAPRVEKLKQRFLSDEEILSTTSTELSTLFWSAKECLFKMDDIQGLDFKSEINVKIIDKQTLKGTIRSKTEYNLYYFTKENWVCCYGI